MKNIVILGGTGSIGTQAVDVIQRFPEHFRVTGISAAGTNVEALIRIAKVTHPRVVVVLREEIEETLREALKDVRIEVGENALDALASGELAPADIVLSAISGISGLKPTLRAVEAGIDVALANKETMVTGGAMIVRKAKASGSRLFPVDSEHSAIRQCLAGLRDREVHRIVLTCSGGPFFNKKHLDFRRITVEDALNHPTWSMGRKITIDSATLMNKGLEVIEARWLFDIEPRRIGVVIHPESIIHSMVETVDGSVMAQMSIPDMRLPILYALTGGEHWAFPASRLDLATVQHLTFAAPDIQRFPCLKLAYDALEMGGTAPIVLNTVNEVAVDAFCEGRISFMGIAETVEEALQLHSPEDVETLDDIIAVERWSEVIARRIIQGKAQTA